MQGGGGTLATRKIKLAFHVWQNYDRTLNFYAGVLIEWQSLV